MTELKRNQKGPKLTSEDMDRQNECLKMMRGSGELERMQIRLYAQLMMNESWREEMKDRSREALQRSGGVSEITLDELVGKLLPHGKAGVPASIQTDCMARIRQACNIPEPKVEESEEDARTSF